MTVEQVLTLVKAHTAGRPLGILGERRSTSSS